MARKLILAALLAVTASTVVSADLLFSIRYYDKNIYYAGDSVDLKLTLTNDAQPGVADQSFYLADDLRQSFGFDLRSLEGEPAELNENYRSVLNHKGAYRVITLSPGQELSMTVSLNDWFTLEKADQYRLTAFFYPELRQKNISASQSESVLDLSLRPRVERRWDEQLSEEIKSVLRNRNLDPWAIVRETFENRSQSRFNRAMLYMDIPSLAAIHPTTREASKLKEALRGGAWDLLEGFDYPVSDIQLISSQIFENEANIRLFADYAPHGEMFRQQLRVYLHKKEGYWSIRRIEALDSTEDNMQNLQELEPAGVVSELIRASLRGDWDIALRYYSLDDAVRNLPEYRELWNQMSYDEHQAAIHHYRGQLISGALEQQKRPLKDLEDWTISRVNYTDVSGTVLVSNRKTHSTAKGMLAQDTLYTFRLEKNIHTGQWKVIRYDTKAIR